MNALSCAMSVDNCANRELQITTIYLDHNIIDEIGKGKATYLSVFSNKEFLPVISIVSIDEIFRGGDWNRSMQNIESLRNMGVKYIHSGPDESHMSISELDYENMYQKWLRMQSEICSLNNSYFLFLSSLFRGVEPKTVKDMDMSVSDRLAWIKNNYCKHPGLQAEMDDILNNPTEYKQRCNELIGLKKLIPFIPKEINNMPEQSVFWGCVEKLKNAADENLQRIGNHIQEAIENATTINDQLLIVFNWLNLFGYYPENMTKIKRIRANFSDAQHATYGIACDAILTSDKRFAKRILAAVGALKLKTEVSNDANELLLRITKKTNSQFA